MYDINHCKFSGTIQDFKRIDTRTGTPMISFKLKCWKETIRVVAFKDLAEQTKLSDGDRAEVVGRLESSNFEYEDRKYNSFQIVATGIDLEHAEVVEPKNTAPQYPEHGQRQVADFEGCPF